MEISELLERVSLSSAPLVEITGGEPLIQDCFMGLAERLCRESGKQVLVETNGSRSVELIPEKAIAIVDVKCPGSGEGGSFDLANLARLRLRDEMKFALVDRADYEWAVGFVLEHDLPGGPNEVLFTPVYGKLSPAELAGWIMEDGLGVRLQIQLHKVLGVR